MKIKFIIALLSALIIPTSLFAQPHIVSVALAEYIDNRQPAEVFTNNLTCDSGESSAPTINSKEIPTIYLWTKVDNDEKRSFTHAWQMEFEGDWDVVADVNLKVGKSRGWRTWSSKNLDPILHVGYWRVLVSADDEPDNVLCSVYFDVE